MAKKSAFGEMSDEERRELGARISRVVDSYESKAAAAVAAQLSTDQLRNIVAGNSAPSALALARLCFGARYSLDWLMTGIGSPRLTFPDAMNPYPGVVTQDVLLSLRMKVFQALAPIYLKTKRPLDPMSDADELFVNEPLKDILRLPEELHEVAVMLVADAHREAVNRLQTPPPKRRRS